MNSSAEHDAQAALRESEARYRAFIANSSEGIWRFDLEEPMSIALPENDQIAHLFRATYLAECNDTMARMYGYQTASDLIGMRLTRFLPPSEARNVELLRAFIRGGYRLAATESWDKDLHGRVRCFVNSLAGDIEDGHLIRAWGVQHDDTDRKQMAEELRRSEERLRSLFGAMTELFFVLDADGQYLEIAPTNPSLLLRPAEELIGRRIHEFFPADQADLFVRSIRNTLATGANVDFEYALELRGEQKWFAATLAPLSTDRVTFLAHDITARKAAEAERASMEAQLRQAQKMEAVGRLASGIAHDFNNLLSVVLSYGQMIVADLSASDPLHQVALEICRAGERAAALTGQLLAFSRQQVLAPEVLDLNEVFRGLEGMLRRILGEDIDFRLELAQKIDPVLADPGQMEQVLMNLIVNARDAMPQGGKLVVETANVALDASYAKMHMDVKPGAYVMFSVTDDGVGMDAETQAHIFEPFYSTKEKGKGTGLGLSTVFGIIRQSGGWINVWSQPGKGARFDLYLPRADRKPSASGAGRPAVESLRGSETILVVEDEDQVRTLATSILRRAGYTVLPASDAGEALLTCEGYGGPIELLLTDVVMPQMNGVRLAKRLREVRPGLRVLCMSGYTTDEVVNRGIAEEGFAFIQKPLTPDALVRRVREVLEE